MGLTSNAVDHGFQQAVLHKAAAKSIWWTFAFAAHGQAQPFGQRVHATHAHAVQAARHLVAVLVELAAGVQFGQRDFGGAALGLVLVVHLHAGGNAAAVVGDADGVVGMDGDHDVIAVPGQRFVDGVVHHLEHQVVQAGAVARVADVHAGALAHGFQPFQDLDGTFAVAFGGTGLVGVDGGLEAGVACALTPYGRRLSWRLSELGGVAHESALGLANKFTSTKPAYCKRAKS
jgi:hypothetical protein